MTGLRPAGANVTVYGPCPGCDDWQVDIADDVPVGALRVNPAASPIEYIYQGAAALAKARSDMLEEAIREHADECPILAAIAEGVS